MIRIFPNDASALRLIGALLAEKNEVWQEKKYLDMDEAKGYTREFFSEMILSEYSSENRCIRTLKSLLGFWFEGFLPLG